MTLTVSTSVEVARQRGELGLLVSAQASLFALKLIEPPSPGDATRRRLRGLRGRVLRRGARSHTLGRLRLRRRRSVDGSSCPARPRRRGLGGPVDCGKHRAEVSSRHQEATLANCVRSSELTLRKSSTARSASGFTTVALRSVRGSQPPSAEGTDVTERRVEQAGEAERDAGTVVHVDDPAGRHVQAHAERLQHAGCSTRVPPFVSARPRTRRSGRPTLGRRGSRPSPTIRLEVTAGRQAWRTSRSSL